MTAGSDARRGGVPPPGNHHDAVAWSTPVGLAMWFPVGPLAHASDLTPEARYAIDYVRVMAVAMPFSGIMMIGSMCMFGAVRPSSRA